MAIWVALGASRGRAIRQLLTENLIFSLLGGCLGLALALSMIRGLVTVMPAEIPRLNGIALDGRVLGFAFVISVLSRIVFGLASFED